ncbi:mucin-binding protein, partial [Enterococcus columbae]
MNKQVMTKKIRYSIRKSKRYKGAISVGIGCLFLLGYLVLGSSIQADETESIHSVEHTETLTETSADLASDSTVDSVESVNDDKVDANTDALSITDVEETPKEQPIQPMEETSEAVASSTDDSNSNQPETKEGTILTSDYQPEKVITIDEPADYPALPLGNAYHPDKYFIFKSVIDNWSGEVYYFAVNRQQDDGVLFIFDQNGNLRQTQLAGSKKQLDNTVVINYGDTYTISHPYNALSYDYSGDGEKSSVEKNAVYNAITGILPKQSIVTVRYVDENQTDIVAPVQKRALSGESRDIQGPISIEGYVYQYTTGNTKGSVSIYSSEKMNQTWSRHFTYSATNSEIRADYTLLDNQGKFRVDIYRNDLLQKSTTLIPGQYTDYAVYTNGAIDRYRFPNPFIPDSGEVIFHYARVGKIVPVDESNQPIPAAPTPSYHTNPDDPENVLPDEPTPDILGYTKTINTITPVNPTEDTPVVYIRNKEVGTLSVRYIDQDNQNQEITGIGETISGTYGDKIVYSTQPTIESLVKKGYELVHDGFTEGGKELGKDNTGKVYDVIFKHGTQTYTPEHPGVPGTPINPEDPTGSQTPQGTTYQDLVKQASQTIHYTGAG